MITCNDAVRQLWQYLDGAVGESDRRQIETHLAFCWRCCGEVEFAKELRSFLVRHADEDLPDSVRGRLLAVLDDLEEKT